MSTILKIGHRGAKGYEPENTLISFQKAIDIGVHGIELDVHLSSDKQLVVIHDETIDRTTNGKGFVNHFNTLALNAFDIPKLTDVLDLVSQKCFVNIELKGIGTAKPTNEIIESYVLEKNWNYANFLVSSFDFKMLEEIHLLNPKIRIGVLTEVDIEKAIKQAQNINAFSIHPYYRLLTKENVILMQKQGFEVYPWTVNSTTEILKIKSYNVNGIISDFPDRI